MKLKKLNCIFVISIFIFTYLLIKFVFKIVDWKTTDTPISKPNITDWRFKVNNTYALVFYGRRKQISILLPYLEANIKKNGGVLDKIIFAVRTSNKEDLIYLDKIMGQNKQYFETVHYVFNTTYKELYTSLFDDDLIFKIDDDIVYISNHTFENMINEYLTNELLFLSANVVNHPLLSYVHYKIGAILPFYEKTPYNFAKIDNETSFKNIIENNTYDSFSKWWTNPQYAAVAHESFLYHAVNNNLQIFDFKKWDFHYNDFIRWSINFILLRGKYVNKIKEWVPYNTDDEVIISSEIPKLLNKHCYALGSAIVAHFSYYPQNEYLLNTTLLNRYKKLGIKNGKKVIKKKSPQ